MFSNTHKLPRLTHLSLPQPPDIQAPSPLWDAADLTRLVGSCPNVCDVGTLVLRPGLHVSELSKLTALTQLCVFLRYEDIHGLYGCMQGLAALTQLHDLEVWGDRKLNIASLLPLTSLTTLTRIEVEWPYDQDNEDGGEGGYLATDTKVSQLAGSTCLMHATYTHMHGWSYGAVGWEINTCSRTMLHGCTSRVSLAKVGCGLIPLIPL